MEVSVIFITGVKALAFNGYLHFDVCVGRYYQQEFTGGSSVLPCKNVATLASLRLLKA